MPIREYSISKEMKQKQLAEHIDSAVFSQRNWYDLVSIEDKETVFDSIFNFVQFAVEKADQHKKIELNQVLLDFEKNHDISINFIIHADRYLVKLPEKKRRTLLVLLIQFCEKLLTENHYDVIIGELSSASDLIFYYAAKKRNIPYLFFWHGRIAGKMEFSDITGQRIGLKEIYEEKKREGLSQEEKAVVEQYLATLKKPDYMKYADTTKVKNIFKQRLDDTPVNRLIKYFKSYLLDKEWTVDMDPSITSKITSRINKCTYIVRKEFYKHYFSTPDFNEAFYLFPLHYQPEASTMTFAQDYLDQIALIRNLVKHIPAGTYLYVKEHPSMAVYRGWLFYDELIKIPNVKLLSPLSPTDECIKHCQGIITLTGTAGYEAILADKPVFVFGNVFYSEYDYAFQCNGMCEFEKQIKKAEAVWQSDLSRKCEQYAFVFAALQSLYEANLNSHVFDLSVLDKQNIARVSESIAIFLRKQRGIANSGADDILDLISN